MAWAVGINFQEFILEYPIFKLGLITQCKKTEINTYLSKIDTVLKLFLYKVLRYLVARIGGVQEIFKID